MRSVMSHQFSQVPKADIQRSSFDRSHGYKTTFDAGALIPFYVDEVLPGDTFNLSTSVFARLGTPLHPIMDNMFIDMFFFFVPNRLIWNNFQRFFGEQDNPGDSTSFLVPTVAAGAGGFLAQSMQDYMGIPTLIPGLVVDSLHLRAYNLIWNQWFRDENLQNSVNVPKGDGPDNVNDFVLKPRGKRHDYFTSALPWPQKGPAVTLPLGSQAPVRTSSTDLITGAQPSLRMRDTSGNVLVGNQVLGANNIGVFSSTSTAPTPNLGVYMANQYADLSQATAATINQLRQAFQIQRMYERDARGGTRYTEIIQSHFGVTSPDARLQRAEYLGGGSTPIQINPIAQTSNTADQTTPQGNLAAMGTASMGKVGFTKSFVEHGVLIGLVSLRADLNYQQGLNRMWSRQTRFDFYWPALSHLGEQAILNKEIYAKNDANDNLVFGYQERYAEYRYKPSLVTGQFRSNFAQTLDSWHLAQNFASLPVLGDTFIRDNPPVQRILAVPTGTHVLFDCYVNLRCARPMPVYGVPGMIDHF